MSPWATRPLKKLCQPLPLSHPSHPFSEDLPSGTGGALERLGVETGTSPDGLLGGVIPVIVGDTSLLVAVGSRDNDVAGVALDDVLLNVGRMMGHYGESKMGKGGREGLLPAVLAVEKRAAGRA